MISKASVKGTSFYNEFFINVLHSEDIFMNYTMKFEQSQVQHNKSNKSETKYRRNKSCGIHNFAITDWLASSTS